MNLDHDHDHDPGQHLVTHQAPEGLLEGAWRRPANRGPAPGLILAVGLAAGILLGVGIGFALPRATAPVIPGATETPTLAATADAQIPVRLVCACEGASQVGVAGSFNNWDAATTPMLQVEDGIFVVTVELTPGRHEYMFVLDGETWMTDALALAHVDDGFGNTNAVIEI